ncbi:MAG: hypothetical protein AAFR52_19545, partial [Pseudomonadota bacterium]
IAIALDTDDRALADPKAMAETLDPATRAPVEAVVTVLPLFARQFPVCREFDDEHAAHKRTPKVELAVSRVVHIAAQTKVVPEDHGKTLEAAATASPEGVQADKKASTTLTMVQNLAIAALGFLTGQLDTAAKATAKAVGKDLKKALAAKIRRWLGLSKADIETLFEDAPADTRRAVRANMDQLDKTAAPSEAPEPPVEPDD